MTIEDSRSMASMVFASAPCLRIGLRRMRCPCTAAIVYFRKSIPVLSSLIKAGLAGKS